MLVRDYMSAPVRTIPSGSLLSEAYALMQKLGIRHLPVVDTSGRLAGLLSEREVYLAKRERGLGPDDVTVDALMVRAPYTVTAETRLEDAAAVMAQRKYGCVVVAAGAEVIGILTTTDALHALIDLGAQQSNAPPGSRARS